MKKLAQDFNTAAQDSNPGSRNRESEALPLSHCALQTMPGETQNQVQPHDSSTRCPHLPRDTDGFWRHGAGLDDHWAGRWGLGHMRWRHLQGKLARVRALFVVVVREDGKHAELVHAPCNQVTEVSLRSYMGQYENLHR